MDGYRARFGGRGGGEGRGDMENSWLRVVNRYIYEYIQLKKYDFQKVREGVKIYVLYCSLLIDRKAF